MDGLNCHETGQFYPTDDQTYCSDLTVMLSTQEKTMSGVENPVDAGTSEKMIGGLTKLSAILVKLSKSV